jgi:DNA polymerase-3 subunit epsilon
MLTEPSGERPDQLPLEERPYLYVDCETTGFGGKHSPCEIAGVLIRNGVILETYETLVNPRRPIPPEVTAIHGISDADVVDAPMLEDALIPLKALAARADAAHNVLFDRPMMKFGEDKTWICTLSWARQHPEWALSNKKLATLFTLLGGDSTGGHDALTDAKMGARVLDHLLRNSELTQSFGSLEELGEYLIDDQRRFQEQKRLEREARANSIGLQAPTAQLNGTNGTAA